VQEVIAAIQTSPCFNVYSIPSNSNFPEFPNSSFFKPNPLLLTGAVKHWCQSFYIFFMPTLSWGSFGPDKVGSTVERSNSITLE